MQIPNISEIPEPTSHVTYVDISTHANAYAVEPNLRRPTGPTNPSPDVSPTFPTWEHYPVTHLRERPGPRPLRRLRYLPRAYVAHAATYVPYNPPTLESRGAYLHLNTRANIPPALTTHLRYAYLDPYHAPAPTPH
jgi:hypothetical protein